MTWMRATSGTAMARFTAVVTCSPGASRKVRVSRPWRNSACGGFGKAASEARTLAKTMAWRKSGTGCAGLAPGLVTMTAVFSLAEEFAVGEAVGAGVRAEDAERVGRGARGSTSVRVAGFVAGTTCLGGVDSMEGFFSQSAQPPSRGAVKSSMRRALPAMRCLLSYTA